LETGSFCRCVKRTHSTQAEFHQDPGAESRLSAIGSFDYFLQTPPDFVASDVRRPAIFDRAFL